MKSAYIYIILLCFLCGCSQRKNLFVSQQTDNTAMPIAYSIYKEAENRNILTGAYIRNNNQGLNTIKAYEDFTAVDNQFYSIALSNAFPYIELWECISYNKTPLLFIPNDYDIGSLFFVAEKFNHYNIPFYVSISCNTTEDVEFYTTAVDIFRQIAPKSTMIWCISVQNYENLTALVPNMDYIDIIGINLVEKGNNNTLSLLHTQVEYLLDNTTDKPVMLNTAISHYSHSYCCYYTYDTIKELNYIYELTQNYPHIMGINYINYSQAPGDDFNITQNKLKTAYENMIQNIKQNNHINTGLFLYQYSNKWFADKNTVATLGLTYKSIDCIYNDNKALYEINANNTEINENNTVIYLK